MQRSRITAAIVALGMALVGVMLATAGGNESSTHTYYEGRQVRVSVKELEPSAAAAILARNSPLHHLYGSEGCEPGGQQFVKVIDVIRADGTSPLWRGVQIEFSPGYPCRQFTSNSEITNAEKAGEISLNPTGYVYRCQVVGSEH